MESVTNRGTKCIIFNNNKFAFNFPGKVRETLRCTVICCCPNIHTNNATPNDVIELSVDTWIFYDNKIVGAIRPIVANDKKLN